MSSFSDNSHCRAWAYVTVSGGTPSLSASFNVSGVTDDNTGELGITIDVDFSSANWSAVGCAYDTSTTIARSCTPNGQDAGSTDLTSVVEAGSNSDPTNWSFAGFGAQ